MCFYTKFQKRKENYWLTLRKNNTKAQIDPILMKEKMINSTLNCKVYSSFERVFFNLRLYSKDKSEPTQAYKVNNPDHIL